MLNIFKIPSISSELDNIKADTKAIFAEPLVGKFAKKKIDIDTYRSKFLGGNARAYLFLCEIQFPGMQNALKSGLGTGMGALGALSEGSSITSAIREGLIGGAETAITTKGISEKTSNFKYYIRSTTLPESSVDEVSTYFCGRQYKMSSVRRTQDWGVSFLVNEDASVLQKFWEWNKLFENPETGIYGKPKDYMTDQTIQLLGLDGSAICTYKLYGAWPKSIGAVTLDYSQNEFATVDITFSYQYHTVAAGNGEPGSGAMLRKAGQSIGANALLGLNLIK